MAVCVCGVVCVRSSDQGKRGNKTKAQEIKVSIQEVQHSASRSSRNREESMKLSKKQCKKTSQNQRTGVPNGKLTEYPTQGTEQTYSRSPLGHLSSRSRVNGMVRDEVKESFTHVQILMEHENL